MFRSISSSAFLSKRGLIIPTINPKCLGACVGDWDIRCAISRGGPHHCNTVAYIYVARMQRIRRLRIWKERQELYNGYGWHS